MDNQYIQYPLKWSLKPPERISAFRASIIVRKHQPCFYIGFVLHKLYKLCATHGHDFSKTTYRQSEIPLVFPPNFHWICWDVGVKIRQAIFKLQASTNPWAFGDESPPQWVVIYGSCVTEIARHRTLERFVAICATLPRQLWRPEVRGRGRWGLFVSK